MMRTFLALAAIFAVAGCQNQGRQNQPATGEEGQPGQTRPSGQRAEEAQPSGQPSAQAPSPQGQQGAQAGETATGTLTRVGDHQISLRTASGEQMQMKLEDNAQITMAGKQIQPESLQEGASVRASYRKEGGQNVVQRLEVQSMGSQTGPGGKPGGGASPSGSQPGSPSGSQPSGQPGGQ